MANSYAPAQPGRKPLSLFEAILPLLTLAGLLIASAVVLDVNQQILVTVLLASGAVAGFIAVRHGGTWDDIQRAPRGRPMVSTSRSQVIAAVGTTSMS